MKTSYAIAFTLLTLQAIGQDTWVQQPDLPGGIRSASTMFSIGNSGYVFGGNYQGTAFNDLWAFDPASDTWTQKASCPCDPRWFPVSFVLDGKGYVATGRSPASTSGLNDLWQYDPVTDTWVQKADLPANIRWGAFGFSVAGKGYVGAGTTGSDYFEDLWEYDPMADTWTQKANYPDGPHFAFGGSFVLNNVAYVAGGRSSGGSSAVSSEKLWAYDPGLDQWTQRANMPGPRLNAASFALSGRGFIVGGTTNIAGGTPQNTTLEYDPIANTWTNRAAFAGGTRTNVGGVAINGKAYVGTGLVSPTAFDDWYEYTPLGGTVGVDESSTRHGIILYPNPANDHIKICLPMGGGEIVMLDGLGRTIHRERTIDSRVVVNLDDLPAGTYQLIFDNGTFSTRKFMKF